MLRVSRGVCAGGAERRADERVNNERGLRRLTLEMDALVLLTGLQVEGAPGRQCQLAQGAGC